MATNAMIPAVAIVDPELMLSLPPYLTAVTGFDVFAHAFEAYVHDNSTPFIETLALRAIEITAENLVAVYKNGKNRQARYNMAYADTLGGMCIALNNTTMPHDIGQAIVGKYPGITHGQSLALVYPVYLDYAVLFSESEIAKLARIFDKSLAGVSDAVAASALKNILIKWQRELGILNSCDGLGIPEDLMDDVIEETMKICAFLTKKAGQGREQVAAIVNKIWHQKF